MEQPTENSPLPETPVAVFISRVSGYVANGLRYWEPRRLIYNLALGLVVVGHFVVAWPQSWTRLTFDAVLGIFFLAVLANVCYCAVYAVDLFVQFSGLQAAWVKGRIAVLIVGTAFASVIAHFFSAGIFLGN